MRALRWLVGGGLRITLLLAFTIAGYHVYQELRVRQGHPLNFLQRLELTALDVKFDARGAEAPKKWHVAIAAVDEKAIDAFGRLPWSRTVHADLVNKLTELGAGSVAFDMTFEQSSSTKERDLLEQIRERVDRAGFPEGAKKLRDQAKTLKRISSRLQTMRKPQGLEKYAGPLKEDAAFSEQLSGELVRFRKGLVDAAKGPNPDEVFADAIKRSGRVVLGVVALSKREVDSLNVPKDQLKRSMKVVASSTISEMVEEGASGLAQVHPGKQSFEQGIYRTYFGVNAPVGSLAKATSHFGMINASPDSDGVNRSLSLISVVRGSGVALPSLALKAVEVASSPEQIEVLGGPQDLSPQGIRIGAHTIPTQLAATTAVDWYGRFDADEMPIFSIADILNNKVKKEDIAGRVVFVAATAIGTHDQRVTPMERAVPGIYIHATLAQNILDDRHLNRPSTAVVIELLVILVIGLLSGLIMTRFNVVGQLVTAMVLVIGWVVADQLYFFQGGTIVYTVLPVAQIFATLLVVALWRFFVEQRERRKTRQAFGRYLSPKVMEQVLSNPEEHLKLGGRRYEATVLFSDIRGFTTISEALSPEELGTLLNQYMTPMTDIVFEHKGTLDKYIGDAVMAFWGAPLEFEDHAIWACRAALKMLTEVERLNVLFEQEGLPKVAIGIGLSSGPMTIGNMGSDDHFEYTALGDRVNLGARLEGQTKDYGVDMIISDTCYEMVKDEMLCRELGSLRVKGKLKPVQIYELIGERSKCADKLLFVETFHTGLRFFRERRWDEAIAHLTEAADQAGPAGDKASRLYIQWCTEYKEAPPPPDWDGVRVATTK